MSVRTGSLPFVFVTAIISFALGGMLWGIFETGFVSEIQAQTAWQTGSANAKLARQFVSDSWDFMLLVILLGIGVEGFISSRLQSTGANLILRTVTLFIFHFFLVLWAFMFPEMIDPLAKLALNDAAVQASGFDTGIRLAYDIGLAYLPGIFAVGIDLWYILAPIRLDAFAGYGGY